MKNYFEVGVSYTKINENTGKDGKITEAFLVDSMSFTEAETKITTKMTEYGLTDFLIKTTKRQKNIEVIGDIQDGELWWKCKITFEDLDPTTGKEKTATNYLLIAADNLLDAHTKLTEYLSTMIVPYSCTGINLSNIVEVFEYETETESENEN